MEEKKKSKEQETKACQTESEPGREIKRNQTE